MSNRRVFLTAFFVLLLFNLIRSVSTVTANQAEIAAMSTRSTCNEETCQYTTEGTIIVNYLRAGFHQDRPADAVHLTGFSILRSQPFDVEFSSRLGETVTLPPEEINPKLQNAEQQPSGEFQVNWNNLALLALEYALWSFFLSLVLLGIYKRWFDTQNGKVNAP